MFQKRETSPDDILNVLVRSVVWGGGAPSITTHVVQMTRYDYDNRNRNNSVISSSGTYRTHTDLIDLGISQDIC